MLYNMQKVTNVCLRDLSLRLSFVLAAIASDLYHNMGVVAFIGPGCTPALDPVGRMAAYWNVPVITGETSRSNTLSLGDAFDGS